MEDEMAVIKIIELLGVSEKSWEDAAGNAVREASKTIQGITGLEIVNQTAKVKNGKIVEYRSDVKVAFVVNEND